MSSKENIAADPVSCSGTGSMPEGQLCYGGDLLVVPRLENTPVFTEFSPVCMAF